jgi:hypothetical protein
VPSDSIEDQAFRIIETAREYAGALPVRIVVEPNGDLEVNVRVAVRGQTHPLAFHKRKESGKRKAS